MITIETKNAIWVGSANLQTSVAGQEILPEGMRLFDFKLTNDQICHVSINGGDYIYLRANQGISTTLTYSVKIQEAGITFNWIGLRS
jgi:hypothetical protein